MSEYSTSDNESNEHYNCSLDYTIIDFKSQTRYIHQLIIGTKNPVFELYLYVVSKLAIKTQLIWDMETVDYHRWYVSEYISSKLI